MQDEVHKPVTSDQIDQVERLSAALAQFGDEFVEVEVHRVQGSGRGEGGGLEWIENLPLEGNGLGEILTRLRDEHGGGRFRLIVREEGTGRMRMNQPAQVVRRLAPVTAARSEEKPDMVALLLSEMRADRKAADERFEKVLASLATAKPAGIDDELSRLVKIKEAFGGGDNKQPDMLELIDKVLGLRDRLEGLNGNGKTDPWAELAREVVPDLLDAWRGMGDGGGSDEEEGGDQDAKLRQALAGFTGKMEQAARKKVPPVMAAGFALKAMKQPAALVRFCQGEDATGKLLRIAPALVEFAGWVEQVRVEIVKQGQRPAQPAALPVATAKAEPHAHDAGKNTERTRRSSRHAQAHAGAGGRGKATGNGKAAGDKARAAAGAKGLPGRGGKAARVRS